MATFGRFETVREIHRTGYTTVYTGRSPESTAEKFAIKVFQPPALLLEEGQAKTEIDLFIKSTQLQQKVAARGAQYWAPIHRHGTSPEGAFYVTDKYEHSLQQLINVRLKLNSKILLAIVESVTKGLMELKESGRRPHGNLKATNVLIGGTGEISQRKIVLCDPLPDEHIDTKVHWDGDLRAIAELIYQLVVHQQSPRVDGWQAPDSKEWRSFGKQAASWRNLCNRLLNAHLKPGTITIEILLEELAQLKKEKPALPVTWFIAAALMVVACAVVVIFLWPRASADPEEWKQLCGEYVDWIKPLSDTLDEERWAKDKHLKIIMDKIKGDASYPGTIVAGVSIDQLGDLDPNELNKYVNNTKIKQALATIKDIRSFFNPDSTDPNSYETWPWLEKMRESANDFNKRGWKKHAAYLSSLVYSVRLESNQPIAENVEKILGHKDTGILKNIDSFLKQIAKDQKTIKSSKDPILGKFDDQYVDREVTSIVYEDDGDDLSRLHGELEKIANLGHKLAVFVKGDWQEKVDRKAFLAVHGNVIVTTANSETFNNRLDMIKDYYRLDPDPREEIDLELKKLQKHIKSARSFHPEEADKLDEGLKKKYQNITDTWKIPGIKMNQDQINTMKDDCLVMLRALDKEAVKYIEDPIEWWEEIEKTAKIAKSDAINVEWRHRRDLELRKHEKSDFEKKKNLEIFISLKEKVKQTRGRLENLDKTLPPNITATLTQTDWNIQLSDLYENKREELLGRIIGEMTQNDILDPNSSKFKDEWRKKLSDLNDWQNKSGQLITAFNEIEDRLEACYLLDDKILGSLWKTWKGDNILKETRISNALTKLTNRVKKLEDIDLSADRQELVKIAKTAVQTEAVYAAWVMLGELPEPQWPSEAQDWQDDKQIQQKLQAEFETIKSQNQTRGDSLLNILVNVSLERERILIQANIQRYKTTVKENSLQNDLPVYILDKLAAFTPDKSDVNGFENLTKTLAEFVTSEDWKKNKYRTDLYEFEPEIITMQTFREWHIKIKDYRILEPDPLQKYKQGKQNIKPKVKTIRELITKEVRPRKPQPTEQFSMILTSIDNDCTELLDIPAIEGNRAEIVESIDALNNLWKGLEQLEKDVRSVIKPEYCKHLELSKDGQLVFAATTGLDPNFEPVQADSEEPDRLITGWEDIRKGINEKQKEWFNFFYTVDLSDALNVGWPKYIRSRTDEDVIFSFIPGDNSRGMEPFYMAIREITNAQYRRFLQNEATSFAELPDKWSYFVDKKDLNKAFIRCEGNDYPSCGIKWDKNEQKFVLGEWANDGKRILQDKAKPDFPVTWVTFDGAESYATWLGAQLPTALQHQYACMANADTPYPWGNDLRYAHVRSVAWENAATTYENDPAAFQPPVPKRNKSKIVKREKKLDPQNIKHQENRFKSPWPLATKTEPNPVSNDWGLYDMIGNVWEWCAGEDDAQPAICGGSCLEPPEVLDKSNYEKPFNSRDCDIGFRVIVLPNLKTSE